MFIEFWLIVWFGSEVVEWLVVDWFLLCGDKVVECVSYFDLFLLLIKVVKYLLVWCGWLIIM